MAEYIKREDTINLVCDACNTQFGDEPCEPNECEIIMILKGYPAADVVERKTGKWIDKWYCSDMSGYEYAKKCSECGKPTYRISLIEPMPKYCPNCGARMVEDE